MRNHATSYARSAVFCATLLTASVQAHWSSDPAASSVLSDAAGHQEGQQIVGTSDGGFFVSWVDRSNGGEDVRMQRLNATGDEQWAHNGILIAARVPNHWSPSGLDVDTAGNAFLAFENDVGGTDRVIAQKIAPDGSFLWGDTGLIMSSTENGGGRPSVSVGGDGRIDVVWLNALGTYVQKLDEAGQPLWVPGGVVVAESGGAYDASAGLHADADGNVVIALQAIVSLFPVADFELHAQKLAAIDGGPLWGDAAITVSDADADLFIEGQTVLDGSGGAVFAWHTTQPPDTCLHCVVHVQHVLADGSTAFVQNGVTPTSDSTRNHDVPSLTYDAVEGDTYVLWRDSLADGSAHGLYAQRIDSLGARQWGEEGLALAGLSTMEYALSPIALAVPGRGMLAAWMDNAGIHSVGRLDHDGVLVWPAGVITFSNLDVVDPNIGMTAALSTHGYAAFAWTTNDSDADIHAQNVNADGTLGVADSVFSNGFDP